MKHTVLALLLLLSLLLFSCSTTGGTKPTVEVEPSITRDENLTRQNQTVYRINENKQRGYQIPAYLVIPTDYEGKAPEDYEFSRLLVYSYKTGTTDPIDQQEKQIRERISLATGVNGIRAVTLWIVFPQDNAELLRLGNDLNIPGKYKRLDLQVVSLVKDAFAFLKEKGIILHDRIALTGYSGEGQFCTRFAMLHPEMVGVVAAGGTSWSPVLPVSKLGSHALPWPLGISNYKAVTGYEFNREAWENIIFYLDQGLKDDRGSCNASSLRTAGFNTSNYPSIWEKFTDELMKNSSNIQIVTYKELGHQRVTIDYRNFLLANQNQDSIVLITPREEADIKTAAK